MSKGGDVLLAVQARLQQITTANGYPITIKDVMIGKGQLTLNLPQEKCPSIEIIQGPENYEHQNSNIVITNAFVLRLIDKKTKTDIEMEDFKSCVIRALFGNAYAGTGNSALNYAGKIIAPRVVRCESDYNMVDANRIYALLLETERITQAYNF